MMCCGLCALPHESSVMLLEDKINIYILFNKGGEKRIRINTYLFSAFSEKKKEVFNCGYNVSTCSKFIEGRKMRSDASNVIERETYVLFPVIALVALSTAAVARSTGIACSFQSQPLPDYVCPFI